MAVLDESGKAERISKMNDFQIPIDVIDLSLGIALASLTNSPSKIRGGQGALITYTKGTLLCKQYG